MRSLARFGTRRVIVLLGPANETARHLGARGLRLRAGNQALRPLGLDLGELVLIDGKGGVGRCGRARARSH